VPGDDVTGDGLDALLGESFAFDDDLLVEVEQPPPHRRIPDLASGKSKASQY